MKELYGIGVKETDNYGRQCLLARRFAETGVRYIQVSTPNVWDQHSDLRKGHEKNSLAVDKPIAGLLTDLKQRGLLDVKVLAVDSNEGCDVADFDGDGKLDVVAGRNWYQNGTWTPRPVRLIEDRSRYVRSNGEWAHDVGWDHCRVRVARDNGPKLRGVACPARF